MENLNHPRPTREARATPTDVEALHRARWELDVTVVGVVADPAGYVLLHRDAWAKLPLHVAETTGVSLSDATADVGRLLSLVVLVADRAGHADPDAAHGAPSPRGERSSYRHDVVGGGASSYIESRARLAAAGLLALTAPRHGGDGLRLAGITPSARRQLVASPPAAGGGWATDVAPVARTAMRELTRLLESRVGPARAARELWRAVLLLTGVEAPGLVTASVSELAELWGCSRSSASRTLTLLRQLDVVVERDQRRENHRLPSAISERAAVLPSAAVWASQLTGREWSIASAEAGGCSRHGGSAVPVPGGPRRYGRYTQGSTPCGPPSGGASRASTGEAVPLLSWQPTSSATNSKATKHAVRYVLHNLPGARELLHGVGGDRGKAEGARLRVRLLDVLDRVEVEARRVLAGEGTNVPEHLELGARFVAALEELHVTGHAYDAWPHLAEDMPDLDDAAAVKTVLGNLAAARQQARPKLREARRRSDRGRLRVQPLPGPSAIDGNGPMAAQTADLLAALGISAA